MAVLGNDRLAYETSGANWGNLPEGWFLKEATSVDVDSKDNVYVFNRGNHPVIVFDSEGDVLRSWGEGEFASPHGITVAPDDTVWLVDNGDHSIRQFTQDGRLLVTLSERHRPSPAMSGAPVCGPTSVAIDPRSGEVLVADGYGNARVHRFSPDGKSLLASWGESGTGPGQFNIVHDIDIAADGMIYVADRENRRIQVFSPDGGFEAQWGNFSRAAAVHLARHGEALVYVGEYFGGANQAYQQAMRIGPRVSVMDRGGNVLARLGEQPFGDAPDRFYAPHMLSSDSRGDIYVAEVSYSEFGSHMDPPRELRSLRKLIRKDPRLARRRGHGRDALPR